MRIWQWLVDKYNTALELGGTTGQEIAFNINTRFSQILPMQLEMIMETIKPTQPCVVVAIYNPETKKVLAVHRKDNPDDWGFPGGKIDKGETPLVAMLRELGEETPYGLVNANYYKDMGLHTEEDTNTPVYVYEGLFRGLYVHIGGCEQNYAWVDPVLLTQGSFGKFNQRVLDMLSIPT